MESEENCGLLFSPTGPRLLEDGLVVPGKYIAKGPKKRLKVGEKGARCNNFASELHNFLSKENKPKQNITFGSPFSQLEKLAKKEF